MEKDFVSIIVPVYNVENYIEKTIRCILNQTYTNYELICIDDGSTDSSGDLLDKLEKEDSRIRVIHKKNEGVSIARNIGISVACGKYIFFFDGDDIMEDCLCERVLASAKENSVDTVIFGYADYKNEEIINKHKMYFKKTSYYGHCEIINEVLPSFMGITSDEVNQWIKNERSIRQGKEHTAVWRTMFSAEVIKSNKITFDKNLKVGEDTIFTLLYLCCCKGVAVVDEILYYLVDRSDSAIHKFKTDAISMIDQKVKISLRKQFVEKYVESKYGDNIENLWNGSTLLSTIELAYKISQMDNYSFVDKYGYFKKWIELDFVQKAIKEYQSCLIANKKSIPFILLKKRFYLMLFTAVYLLNVLGIEINAK